MATPVIKHSIITGAAADPSALVDGPAWDDAHTVTGLENVPNVDTTNADNITSGTFSAQYGEGYRFLTNQTNVNHGPFAMGVFDSGNPYLDIGYNIDPNNWSLINSGDRGLFFGQEGDYNDGSGHNKMEQYWQYQRVSGQSPIAGAATYCRTLMAQYDKVTNLPTALLLSSGGTNGVIIHYNDGTGTPDQEQVIGKPKAQFLASYFYVNNQPSNTPTQAFVVDSSTANAATGLAVQNFPAGSGLHLATLSSGTNETLYIDAKGGGQIYLGGNSTGSVNAGAAIVGGDATNRGNLVLNSGQVDASTNGIEFKSSSASSGYGFRIATVYDGVANMDLKFQNRQNSATWTDIFKFAGATGNMNILATATATGGILSSSASAGVGYATGSGGTVTQGTSRTTGVTLNKTSGAITLFSAAGSASFQTFTLTNSAIAVTDVVYVTQKSGTDKYQIFVTNTAAGSCQITFATTGGTTTEQPVFSFAVIKAVVS